ncbi:MAG: hypothetical protein ABR507_03655 [Actinomycetota bacterium]|nr:DUF975 family protein [Actinomycetota bacterium]
MAEQRWHAGPAFNNTFKDIRGHSSTSFFTAAILCLPSLFASVIISSGAPLIGYPLQFIALFASGIWLPVAIISATRMYATGTDPGVGGLLDETASWRLFSYLGTTFLIFLLFFAAIIVAFIPAIGVGVSGAIANGGDITRAFRGGNGVLTVLTVLIGFALAATFGLIIYLRYGLAPVINVLERLGPAKSLKRSRDLMKGRWMDLFVLFVMVIAVTIVAYIVVLGPSLVVTFASGITRTTGPLAAPRLGPVAAIVSGLSTYLYSIIITVISTGTLANFYLGIRGDEAMMERQQRVALMSGAPAAWPSQGSVQTDQGDVGLGERQTYPGEQQDAPRDDENPGQFPEN